MSMPYCKEVMPAVMLADDRGNLLALCVAGMLLSECRQPGFPSTGDPVGFPQKLILELQSDDRLRS